MSEFMHRYTYLATTLLEVANQGSRAFTSARDGISKIHNATIMIPGAVSQWAIDLQ